jgi:hypothetical protein
MGFSESRTGDGGGRGKVPAVEQAPAVTATGLRNEQASYGGLRMGLPDSQVENFYFRKSFLTRLRCPLQAGL